jgi:hypothetical protein
MKKYFVVTIDTEIDKSRDWSIPDTLTFSSIIEGIPRKLNPLFNQYNVKATYLLSPEVIEDNNCVSVLKELNNTELGTHLHGDLIEPERTHAVLAGIHSHEMQCTYTKLLERSKITTLTRLFEATFGYNPLSFRAGRFGIGNETLSILSELGYKVDTSVTPGVNWIYPEGISNHTSAPEQPYFADIDNFLEAGSLDILEVPVSIIDVNIKDPPDFLSYLWLRKKIRFLFRRDYDHFWLRPSFSSLDEMIYVIARIENKFRDCDNIVVNMMFHTNEVIPNASPYTKTEGDCRKFLERIRSVLEYCRRKNFQFVKLSDLYGVFREMR